MSGLWKTFTNLYSLLGYLSSSLDEGKHCSRLGSKRRPALGVRPSDCVVSLLTFAGTMFGLGMAVEIKRVELL